MTPFLPNVPHFPTKYRTVLGLLVVRRVVNTGFVITFGRLVARRVVEVNFVLVFGRLVVRRRRAVVVGRNVDVVDGRGNVKVGGVVSRIVDEVVRAWTVEVVGGNFDVVLGPS